MNLNRFALVFIVLVVTASPAANTQTTGVPVRVDTAVALKQIMTRVEPPLSPELVAANPGAVLAADLVVRSDGSVESVTLIAGPQGFERALVTALRQWTFKPFNVNGRPARVVTMIDIALPNPQQEAEQRAYADYADARRAGEPDLRDNYSNRLAGVLQQAAELKRTLGQAAEAKAFEARATRLAR